MKAHLIFDLTQQDDVKAHQRAIKATDMAIVLFEIYYNLSKKLESKVDLLGDVCTPDYVIEATIQEINRLLDERNLIIDDLID